MSNIESILADLIRFPSVTPEDAGCQEYMIQFLEQLGFKCQRYPNPPVSNFFAIYGHDGPLLVFAGHTDVVSVGSFESWRFPPFQLTEDQGQLFGRGVTDMKGSLAAMLVMAQEFVRDYPNGTGRLGFLITSGEEGSDFDKGTPYVMAKLKEQGIQLDYCIVGEPSSTKYVGDTIKNGRRGSLSGHLRLTGVQGHVAYPQLANNPIHALAPALNDLVAYQFDAGNAYFPPTSFQISNIHAGTGALNIIPGSCELDFNIRFSTEHTVASLQAIILNAFAKYDLHPEIIWQISGQPFLTAKGILLEKTVKVLEKITGNSPEISTTGGTSDGRFIAPYGVEIIELGLSNASIHQVNEWIEKADLLKLKTLYYEIVKEVFCFSLPFDK